MTATFIAEYFCCTADGGGSRDERIKADSPEVALRLARERMQPGDHDVRVSSLTLIGRHSRPVLAAEAGGAA